MTLNYPISPKFNIGISYVADLNQTGALDQNQQLWRNPGRTQERNLMQNQNRNFLGNQIGVPYQNQQMRQNQGTEQESQWRRNQSQNIWQREHMAGISHQNQQIRQNLGMEQGNQWNQNWQQEQIPTKTCIDKRPYHIANRSTNHGSQGSIPGLRRRSQRENK